MLALGLALGATAFALPNPQSTAQVKDGGTFRIGQWASIHYVDPALAYSTGEWPLLRRDVREAHELSGQAAACRTTAGPRGRC